MADKLSLHPPDDGVMDEFSYETRMVVLNFMSLLPVEGMASGSGSLASSGSLERNRRSIYDSDGASDTYGRSSVDSSSWQQTLPSLPEASLVERVIGHGDPIQSDGMDGQQALEDEPDTAERPANLSLGQALRRHSREPSSNSSTKCDSSPPSPPQKPRSIPPPQKSVDRQVSNISGSSDSTDMSDISSLMFSTHSTTSRRSNYVDAQCQDLDPLVRQGVLPPQVLPLQHQLNKEMDSLHKQFVVKGKSPSPNPKGPTTPVPTPPPPLSSSVSVMTPQSEVAEQLRNIGDVVHKEYGKVFDSAFDKMINVPKEKLSYSFAEIILNEMTENIPSVTHRAAIVMLLSQRLAMYGRDLHSMVDYTVQFLTDRMASYVLNRGGWTSILALEEPAPPADLEIQIPVISAQNPNDVRTLGIPGPPLHAVSTASGTLAGEELQETINSMMESGFISDSQDTVINRDATLNSIATMPSEVATPVDVVDSGAVNGVLAAVQEDESPSGTEVYKMKREIHLLRQISDAHTPHQNDSDPLQTLALVALGSTLACCALYVIYKKVKK